MDFKYKLLVHPTCSVRCLVPSQILSNRLKSGIDSLLSRLTRGASEPIKGMWFTARWNERDWIMSMSSDRIYENHYLLIQNDPSDEKSDIDGQKIEAMMFNLSAEETSTYNSWIKDTIDSAIKKWFEHSTPR